MLSIFGTCLCVCVSVSSEKILTFRYLVFAVCWFAFYDWTNNMGNEKRIKKLTELIECDRCMWHTNKVLSSSLFQPKHIKIVREYLCVSMFGIALLFCIFLCYFIARMQLEMKFEPEWGERVTEWVECEKKRERETKTNETKCEKAHMKWKTHLQRQRAQLRY